MTIPPVDPARIAVQIDPDGAFADVRGSGVRVHLVETGSGGLRVEVGAVAAVSRVRLRWAAAIPEDCLVLGDAWERSYGELEWRGVRAERILPWTALAHHPRTGRTDGWGVEVRGASFAFWQVDRRGVTLTLDLRSGGAAVVPGDRVLTAAIVHVVSGSGGAFAAQRSLLRRLCPQPLTTGGPLVGANNWYYAYGRDFGLAAVVRDARTIADLVGDHAVRPFGVVDDGWSSAGTADGLAASPGPWRAGRPDRFPDMAEAAEAVRAEGVRPGVWFRPLLTREEPIEGVRAGRDGALALDPSSPAVLELVAEDTARLSAWGFELIKHDFSTYDLLGSWGPDFGAAPGSGPALHDPSVTTAEALVRFYATVRAAAGEALVLGCNIVGHLAAGLVHAQRVGDDTSGLHWDRTRRVGVNALAFRLAQHDAFFTLDADCVPSTTATDWALNRRFLDLIARSGTALFVSVDPATRTDAVDADLAQALRLALDGGTPGGVAPLDWLHSPTPSRWSAGDDVLEYDWVGPDGADAFEPFLAGSPDPAL